MKPTLGMVVALASEARALLGLGRRQWVNQQKARCLRPADDSRLIIACAGVGVTNALAAAHRLVAQGVSALASSGLAGGLDPHLGPGHIVIATRLLHMDGDKIEGPWNADPTGVALAHNRLTAEGFPVRCGTMLTASQEILTRDRKQSLFGRTQGLAVDMESAAVARVAQEVSVPFFCLRVICDPAQQSIPHQLSRCLDTCGKIRLPSVLLNLARRPSLAIDIFRLSRNFGSAMPVLRRAWRILISANLPQQIASMSQGL